MKLFSPFALSALLLGPVTAAQDVGVGSDGRSNGMISTTLFGRAGEPGWRISTVGANITYPAPHSPRGC